MKKFTCLFFCFLFNYSFTQGIYFEKDLTWDQVVEKAQKEDKLIFADCFTTWCGPCKRMDKETFSDDSVGTFFNKHFVNIKVQMDKTRKDNEWTQTWHKSTADWSSNYNITSFPTYLVFDKTGKIVNRSGSYQSAEKFLTTGKNLINIEDGFYSKLQRFENGERDSLLLSQLLSLTEKFYQLDKNNMVLEAYLQGQEDWMSSKNLDLIMSSHPKFQSKVYNYVVNHKEEITKHSKYKTKVNRLIYQTVDEYLIQPNLGKELDWAKVNDSLRKYLPEEAALYLFKAKVDYLREHIDIDQMQKVIAESIDSGNEEWKYHAYGEFSFAISRKSTDKHTLEMAKFWIGELIFSDPLTKAKIEYKLGNTEEAIKLLEEEIERPFPPKPEFIKIELKELIKKMQKGEKI
ncbi:MAG: thioredoxin family protein [Saprospiraceae bacterium]|nr:thioredoxin family protein [Saprospiraceae bacterium]MBP7643037.1 thioredoxin family protein [Saprospiraceae bacterium]